MNYGVAYNPNYAGGAPAYAPYGAPYAPPQYPLVPTFTGQFLPTLSPPAGGPTGTPTGTPTGGISAITTPAWWKEPTFGIPRMYLAGGAAALGVIAYGWSQGWFGGRTGMKAASRDPLFSAALRDRGGKRRRRSRGRRRGRRDASLGF